jgi:uncharacterized protein YdhG (YjbR/CyaY superfamily)
MRQKITMDQYMAKVPGDRRGRMELLIGSIRSWFPDAEISMKFKMPTFEIGDNWVAVGNRKNYISLYTCMEEHIAPYIENHPGIKYGKGCINFRDRDEIDYGALRAVVTNALIPVELLN